jgi:hypothetical protein
MAEGQAVMIWFIGSGIACMLFLAWAAIVGLGEGRHRALAMTLLLLTGALAIMPSSFMQFQQKFVFSYTRDLFIGASLCLLAAVIVLWKLRRDPLIQRSADLGIAACLNLWLALWATLTPFSFF